MEACLRMNSFQLYHRKLPQDLTNFLLGNYLANLEEIYVALILSNLHQLTAVIHTVHSI